MAATCSPQPASAASTSMNSPWTSVESTSITMSRLPRRCRPAFSTAMSTPVSVAAAVSAVRSGPDLAPETISSRLVTGWSDSREMESMLPPISAMAVATPPTAPARSGRPSMIT
jgi:hypothetical protein